MKKIFIALFAVAVSAVSCLNLDEVAYSKMTADNYYSNFSESDVPAALGTIYSDLRKLYAGASAHTSGNWHAFTIEAGLGKNPLPYHLFPKVYADCKVILDCVIDTTRNL